MARLKCKRHANSWVKVSQYKDQPNTWIVSIGFPGGDQWQFIALHDRKEAYDAAAAIRLGLEDFGVFVQEVLWERDHQAA